MEEIWKDIVGFPGYQVSNLGRVRTFNKVSTTQRHGERHWKNRILKPKCGKTSNSKKSGYKVDLWKENKAYGFLVARLTAFTFYNEDINNHLLTVDHLDGNRLNNNIDNLELVSLEENIRRAFKNDLMPCKRVEITNKETNEIKIYQSMSEASKSISQNHGYISAKIKRNVYENKKYKWKLIEKKGK